jgi:hypothetical protein
MFAGVHELVGEIAGSTGFAVRFHPMLTGPGRPALLVGMHTGRACSDCRHCGKQEAALPWLARAKLQNLLPNTADHQAGSTGEQGRPSAWMVS